MHFEGHLTDLAREGRDLGPVSRLLSRADLTMVNLESAITLRGVPDAKERETPDARYWFRAPPRALGVLARSGVDVVTMANNHGADFGPVGLRDSLRAARRAPLAVVGVGRDRARAFAPYRTVVRDTEVAVLGADASFRESGARVWQAGPQHAGLATARGPARGLRAAVARAAEDADVVVVYLHWGEEGVGCPTPAQRTLAESLAEAGADVVVGSHPHVLLGSGWLGRTYVGYGLGNFLWYHGRDPHSGVLELEVADGRVVGDTWRAARIPDDGPPVPVGPVEAQRAVSDRDALRGCTGLRSRAPGTPAGTRVARPLPPYDATVRPIGAALAQRMRGSSHRPGCPVRLADLRHLRVTHVGPGGAARTGELVVAARHARDVVAVFRRLYAARWPIERMRLIEAYGGDDDRSMAANNSSGYNCRRVAGQQNWSDHARGAAIDLNPVQNPYLTDVVAPPRGRRFANFDRSRGAAVPSGLIADGDPVVRAFRAIGWTWGGTWSQPDYQHFAAP